MKSNIIPLRTLPNTPLVKLTANNVSCSLPKFLWYLTEGNSLIRKRHLQTKNVNNKKKNQEKKIQPLTRASSLHPFTEPFQFFPPEQTTTLHSFLQWSAFQSSTQATLEPELMLCSCIQLFMKLFKGNLILLLGWVYLCCFQKEILEYFAFWHSPNKQKCRCHQIPT